MTTNKIDGADPEKDQTKRMQEHRKIEKVERIKSIDEVENERARKQRFRKFMEEEEAPPEKKPSPLESGFYQAANNSTNSSLTPPRPSIATTLGSMSSEIVPDPAHSVPPSVQIQSPQPMDSQQASTPSPMPRSQAFWNSTNTSATPQSQNNCQEISSSESNSSSSDSQNQSKNKKKTTDILPNQLPDVPLENKLGTAKQNKVSTKDPIKVSKSTKEPLTKPIEAPFTSISQTNKQPPRFAAKPETAMPQDKQLPPVNEKATKAPLMPNIKKSFNPDSNSDGKRQNQETRSIGIVLPTNTALPSHIEPIAQAAAIQSMAYLSPHVAPLFFQMVGTIYAMASPSGVSITQVVLNSPSFANSRFFGSTITLERYSTAPDAFNIRLTGTTEAVNAFQQNIASLYAAFQNGNFQFRIGRIYAEYSTEKPLFRRKEAKGKTADDGEDFTDTRGSK